MRTLQGDRGEGALMHELEAAILANPDDVAAFQVYGDYLLQQGDIRGQLVTLQHTDDVDGIRKFLLAHQADLLGPLAHFTDHLDLHWYYGFLRTVTVRNTHERLEADPEFVIEDLVEQLLECESAKFLRELVLGIMSFEENDYVGAMARIGKRVRPSLRSLYVGDFESEETELNWSDIGDATPLFGMLPNLEELTFRSGSMRFRDRIVFPALKRFTIRTGGLTGNELAAIATAEWPKLETLSIQLGSSRYGAKVTLADVDPILAGGGCPPTLRHLALANSDLTEELIPRIAASAILPRLRELDLSQGTLGNAGGRVLLEHRNAFAHLEKLDLSESWLHGDELAAVRAAFPNANLADQRFDPRWPDDRYIAAGE